MSESLSSSEALENIPFDTEVSVQDAIAILGEALNKSDQEVYECFGGIKATLDVSRATNGIVIKFSKLEDVKKALGGDPVAFGFRFNVLNTKLNGEYEKVFDRTFVGTGAIQSATILKLKNGGNQIVSRNF